MLREELGRSSNVAVGVDDAIGLKQKLARAQQLLYDDYDWPFLRERFVLQLNAGQRYYTMPAGLNIERIEETYLYYGTLPRPMERGIEEEDFASFNSDNGVMADPALKWDVRWTGTSEQIEIWPIPASQNNMVFRGIRNLRPLLADADVCDIDDQVIVLTCAGELLAKSDSSSSAMLVKLAGNRLERLKSRMRGAAKRYRQGMGGTPSRPTVIVVRAA